MKKFNGDGPGCGSFDFGATTAELSLAKSRTARVNVSTLAFKSPLPATTPGSGFYRRFGKRILDVTLVLLSLPVTLPVITILVLALWLEGGAPVYTQKRVGRNGRTFRLFKLRTMVRDADDALNDLLTSDPAMKAEWNSLQKLKVDPRVTRVGAFLRATSLDELPQVLNVLRGEMSLVGPRPMMPDQQQLYGDMRAYAALRPGITGLWQVSARNGNTFRYRNEVDAAYARDLSFGKDLIILARTLGVVLRGTGY